MARSASWILGGVVGAGIVILTGLALGWVPVARDFILGITAGIVSSTVVALILGVIRSPMLTIEIGQNSEADYPQRGRFRFVHVLVRNEPVRIVGWQLRRPATFCRATLEYGDLNARVPRFSVDGRWTSTPEPLQYLGDREVVDPGLALSPPREIFIAGEQSPIPVAIKQNGVQNCFAFNNRSYFYPNWSNPDWALGNGTYWVKVTVKSAEVEIIKVFYLTNTGATVAGLQVQDVPPR